ncbi:hypothetical protein GCM10027072_62900 [Streptomyces bullii]
MLSTAPLASPARPQRAATRTAAVRTRQPLLVISPYSRVDTVDRTATEQASITRFIEDNWHAGRIGDASFDQRAGTLTHMFDFRHPNDKQVLLNQDGSVRSVKDIPHHTRTAVSVSARAPYAPYVQDLAARNVADTGSASPALPVALAAGLLTAGTATVAFALRRRGASSRLAPPVTSGSAGSSARWRSRCFCPCCASSR